MTIAGVPNAIDCSSTKNVTPCRKDRYRIIGPVYDVLSAAYSGRGIYRVKTAMNADLKEGDKVLFAGAGHGRDAIDAARHGAQVTVVDLSPTMLKKVSQNIEGETFKFPINLIHSDILAFDETENYDQVVANFFLNVFPENFMKQVMAHLGALVKPGGHLVVGDFHYPSGNIFIKALQNIYWYIAVIPFTLLAGNAFHKIYNYPEYMESLGFSIVKTRRFSILSAPLLWSVKALKQEKICLPEEKAV